MLTGLLVIVALGVIAVLTHRNSRIEQVILKDIYLWEWLTILVLPMMFYIGWILIVKSILERPKLPIFPLDDFDVIAITILFLSYGSIGNALHFISKVMWRYISKAKKTMLYRINEMFHDKLSHYLIYLGAIFTLFLLPILEINHPIDGGLMPHYLAIIIVSGIVFGNFAGRGIISVNEWFGGYNKPLFFVIAVILGLVLSLYKSLHLSVKHYPVSIFIISMGGSYLSTFIFRQIVIYSKLNNKRKLKFLTKLFQA